jgi:hypothetical protein
MRTWRSDQDRSEGAEVLEVEKEDFCEAMRGSDAVCRCTPFCTQENRLLSSVSPFGCSKLALEVLAERRFFGKSGRRDSNPRQPAWKADSRVNAARLFSSGFRRALIHRRRHLSTIEADGRTRWEADGSLLSLSSYPLALQKASSVGKMFYCCLFVNDDDTFHRRGNLSLLWWRSRRETRCPPLAWR